MIQLHCFGESGNSYKAALTLALAGLDWEPVYVDFFGGEARSEAFRQINLMGEAPVLIDGDLTLTQSGVMQLHVAKVSGKLGWANETEEHEVMRWLFWDNHKMSSQAGMLRFQMNFLAEKHRNADVIAFLSGRVRAALKVLEAGLDGRDWLATPGPSIADIACCSYLYYPEPFGFDRAAWPNIDRWLTALTALPGWKHPYDLMPGSPADRA